MVSISPVRIKSSAHAVVPDAPINGRVSRAYAAPVRFILSTPIAGNAQARMLADELESAVRQHAPSSVAIIGCSGGNGFERLIGTTVELIVAIDINPTYVAAAQARFGTQLPQLVLCVADIQNPLPNITPVEMIFAGNGIVGLATVRHDLEDRKPAARLQHAPDLAVEPRPVGDVHRYMLHRNDSEMTVAERQIQRAGRLKRHLLALSRALGSSRIVAQLGQVAHSFDERLVEVDAHHPAAIGRSQKAPAGSRSSRPAVFQPRHTS
jgi:SAM-dependent methyltransferase